MTSVENNLEARMSVEVSALQIQPYWLPSVRLYCPALLAQLPWPLKLYYCALLAQLPWPLYIYYSTTHRVMLGRINIAVICVERGLPLGTT